MRGGSGLGLYVLDNWAQALDAATSDRMQPAMMRWRTFTVHLLAWSIGIEERVTFGGSLAVSAATQLSSRTHPVLHVIGPAGQPAVAHGVDVDRQDAETAAAMGDTQELARGRA